MTQPPEPETELERLSQERNTAQSEWNSWSGFDSDDSAMTTGDYAARQIGATFALTAAVYEVATRLHKLLEAK